MLLCIRMALKQLKHMVSKKKRRFKEDGFDLDLSYITDNIIAMGFPAENLEGVYRNHIDDVVRFLETRHKDHYRIYNLCRDRAYNTAKFHDRVICFPLDDHHPPSLRMMKPFCEDVHQWLSLNPQNVAAVHCKAGKGRTGVMICAYLLYVGAYTSPDEALAYYGERRTTDMNGVTIPSQRRYVYYFGRMLRENLQYRPVPMILKAIHFELIPNFEKNGSCSPYFVVRSHEKKLHRSPVYEAARGARCLSMDIPPEDTVSIINDVRVDFFHRPGRLPKREKMFHFWFNTYFVCPGAGSPSTASNHNRIESKQSDPEFGPRSLLCRQHHQHLSRQSAFCPNGTVNKQDGCSSGNGQNGSRKDSTESGSTTASLTLPPTRSTRCHSNPHNSDSIYACHHVLTLSKNELDVAFKDKMCKRFAANFKVHVVLQCADLSHCPLAARCGVSQHGQQQLQMGELRLHDRLAEEGPDEEDATSTESTEGEEEDEEEEESEQVSELLESRRTREPQATVDEEGRLITAAFCDLCRSTETMEQAGVSNGGKGDSGESRPSPRQTKQNMNPGENEESDEYGGVGCLLVAPKQKWSNRRSSSPR